MVPTVNVYHQSLLIYGYTLHTMKKYWLGRYWMTEEDAPILK